MLFDNMPVCVRGGGDLATGLAYRLVKAGFPVVVLELERPLVIRRAVAAAEAVFSGEIEIEGLVARRVDDAQSAATVAQTGTVAVLADPKGESLSVLRPVVVVDARMIKSNPGDTTLDLAPLVLAIGPGYTAGKDCHAVIETNRGHDLGRVIWQGMAEPDTGVPGKVGTHQADRVLRAPADGAIESVVSIGDQVRAGQLLAHVGGKPLLAPFDGVLRGLAHDGVQVPAGKKIGDVDPRGIRRHSFTISDKALAVGGGVLEAVLAAPQLQNHLQRRHD
jgi:xanthine dehydrogenase accessory factor